jgi:hypothetical protein
VKNPLNWPLRAYGAMDALFGPIGRRMAEEQAAERFARMTHGGWSATRVLDLAHRFAAGDATLTIPEQAIGRKVVEAGERGATRITLREGFGRVDKVLTGLNDFPVIGPLLVPFRTGPNAAIRAGYEHSPAAGVVTLAQVGKDLVTGKAAAGGYGTQAEQLARASYGLAALPVAYGLYEGGWLTGKRPTDPRMAALWDSTGKVEDSIDLGGGRHLPIAAITPLAPTLTAFTRYMDSVRDGKPANEQAFAAGTGFLEGFANLPFMDAWSDISDLKATVDKQDMAGAQRVLERVGGGRLGGLVPASGLLRSVERGREIDPYPRAPASLGQRLQSGVPVFGGGLEEPPPPIGADAPEQPTAGAAIRGLVRQTPLAPLLAPRIEGRRGPLGERLQQPAGLVESVLSPLRATTPSTEADATYTEAQRVGVGFPTAPTTVQAEGGPVDLTPAQQGHYKEVLGRFAGSYRDALIATPRYQQAPLEQQQALTKATDALARADARDVALADLDIAPARAAGEPERYDLVDLAGRMRGRVPDPLIAAYVAHPALMEADARRAARKIALYHASRGVTPRPTSADGFMAAVQGPLRTPAWQRWAHGPGRQAAALEDAFLAGLAVDSVGGQYTPPAAPTVAVPAA